MSNKNVNLTLKHEKENNGKIKKVKNKENVRGKPCVRDEKPQQVKDKISYTLKSCIIYEKFKVT